MFLIELVCGLCGKGHSKDEIQTVCRACGRPLLARYDLPAARAAFGRERLAGREASLWRYRELLPLAPETAPVTLGEGWTPLLPVDLSKLRRSGWIQAHQSAVIFNTGAGLKYLECYTGLQGAAR